MNYLLSCENQKSYIIVLKVSMKSNIKHVDAVTILLVGIDHGRAFLAISMHCRTPRLLYLHLELSYLLDKYFGDLIDGLQRRLPTTWSEMLQAELIYPIR